MTKRAALQVLAFALAMASRATAQVELGQLKANLSGNVTGGYTADFGAATASDHGITVGGAATLSGSYYDPGFLTFSVQPFYNQSWANSDSQSIANSSGVSASSSIFGGSNTPGSVSYSKVINGTGTFGVPGVANYTSHGDSDTFGVSWTEHLPSFPTVSIGYQQGSNDYSVYGTSSDIVGSFHGINGTISEMIAGFSLNGSYHYSENRVGIPEIIGGVLAETSVSRGSSYSAGLGHKLPFHGAFAAGASRSYVNSGFTGGSYKGTLDNVNAGISFNPIGTLNVSANAQYNDNLLGSIYAPIAAAGGVLPTGIPNQASHSLDIIGTASYRILRWHLVILTTEDHRDQTFLGFRLSSDVVTGTVGYSTELKGGFLNVTGGLNMSTVSQRGGDQVGLLGSGSYSRHVGNWNASVTGNYAQSAQTMLIGYTTNSYGYSGSLSRKFHRTSRLALIGSGNRTALVGAGTGSFSQTFSTSVFIKKITGTAGYTHSSGNGILTSSGVNTTTPLLPVLSPTASLLYGGDSYSFSVASSPIRGLTLSASYSQAISNTNANSVTSSNHNEQLNTRVQYLVRKISFQAGYLRLLQGFSGSGVAPVNLNSVYVGLQRWFNFF